VKSLWALSAIILFIGICVLAYSYFPETVSEPYTTWVTQSHDNVLKDGTVSAWYDYFIGDTNFNQGDQVFIVASTSDGTLTAQVYDVYANEVIQSQDNVANINLNVTIPSSSYYEIKVSRYRSSIYVLFTLPATANVHVATHTTEQVPTTAYRDVTIYPHKDLVIVGIAIMVAGIGVGVLTIAQDKKRNETKPNIDLP
jgi:hypothetical protein